MCSKPHVLARPRVGFDFPTQSVGSSTWKGSDGNPVNVLYDPSTGAAGLAAAKYILAHIDDLMTFNDWCFGVRGLGGNVIVCAVGGATDGTGGAYHYGCNFGTNGGDWYCDVSPSPVETFGLAQAEISESYMGLQGKGWNCGGSGGEGLSRVLAEVVSGGPTGALGAFASGDSWDGTDWISKDQGTDQDYPSIGCSVLYLYWMLKLGFTIDRIVQAGEPGGTLAGNYKAVTGKTTAFADFQAAVQAVGGPGGFRGDNPFNAPVPAYPVPGGSGGSGGGTGGGGGGGTGGGGSTPTGQMHLQISAILNPPHGMTPATYTLTPVAGMGGDFAAEYAESPDLKAFGPPAGVGLGGQILPILEQYGLAGLKIAIADYEAGMTWNQIKADLEAKLAAGLLGGLLGG